MDLGTKMNGISIIMALQVVATRLAHDISLRFCDCPGSQKNIAFPAVKNG
jgi:hypothetical protein